MENREELKEVIREVVKEVINPEPNKVFRIDIEEGNLEDSEVCAICGTNRNLHDDQPWYYCSRCEETYKTVVHTIENFEKIIKQTLIEFKVEMLRNLSSKLKNILP